MKNRFGSRALSVLVAMTLWNVAALLAVAQQPWQPAEFPISYWHGPPASSNTLETWKTVKDCNFTFCGPRGGYSIEDNRRMLDGTTHVSAAHCICRRNQCDRRCRATGFPIWSPGDI